MTDQITIDKFTNADGSREYEVLVIRGKLKPVCVNPTTGMNIAFHLDTVAAERFAISLAKYLEHMRLNPVEPDLDMEAARKKYGKPNLTKAGQRA